MPEENPVPVENEASDVAEPAPVDAVPEPEPEPVVEPAPEPRKATLPRGKKPYRPDVRDLLLRHYSTVQVPTGVLGHDSLIGQTDWGMLGNDAVGDCVWAGSDHEVMLWCVEAQVAVSFTAANALSDYSAVTGYNPDDPNSDQGTDVRTALNYRVSTGTVDAAGNRHKIGAYVAVTPGDLDEIKQGIYLFSVVGIGINFPVSAEDQFNAGQPWSVVEGSDIDGGHYVPVVGFDPTTGYFYVVTWGRLQAVTPEFIQKYMDEGYAILSPEMLSGGKSLEGFDLETLQADLTSLSDPSTPAADPDKVLAAVLAGYVAQPHVLPENVRVATAAKKWLAAKDLAA